MKIFIEGTPFFRRKTGIDHYTLNLITALLDIDQSNRYSVVGFRADQAKTPNLPTRANFSYRYAWFWPKRIYHRLVQINLAPPLDLLTLSKADTFIFPNYYKAPLLFGGKSVVIIYDLSFVLHPQFVAPGNREYLANVVAKAVKKADHILTISENTKREIINYYGVPEAKISIAYPAIDPALFKRRDNSEVSATKTKFKISGNYILFTSTLEPRKNVQGLLEAYEQLPKPIRVKYSLVLAGGKGWLDESIIKTIERLRDAGENIITTGYVADEDLPPLYSGATAFAYPSHYEGFGIPVLEAMACETPVITSNTSSLPEAAGNAAILVTPGNTSELAKALEKVLTDTATQTNMRKKGLEQVRKFEWTKSATGLLRTLEGLSE